MQSQTPDNDGDLLLERAGILVAEGDFEAALPLLDEIARTGDEIQKEMAEAYLEQVTELLLVAAEDDELPAEEGVADALLTAEAATEEVAEAATEAVAEQVEELIEETPTEEALPEVEPLFPEETVSAEGTADLDEQTVEATQTDDAADTQESLEQPSFVLTESLSVSDEIDTALEQAKVLLDSDETETAAMLLEMVIADGTAAQKEQAQQYLQRIEQQELDGAEVQATEVAESVEAVEAEVQVAETVEEEVVEAIEAEDAEEVAVEEITAHAEAVEEVAEIPLAQAEVAQTAAVEAQSIEAVAVEAESIAPSSLGLESPIDALGADLDFMSMTAQLGIDAGKDIAEDRQGFRVGDVGLMIRYIDGSELTDLPELYYIPNSPSWFLGVTNLHGVVVPVFDLVGYFGLQSRTLKNPKLLVLGHGNDAAGIVIDGLPQRLSWLPEQQVGLNMSPDYLRPQVKTACLIEDHLWLDLDVSSLCERIESELM